MRIAFPLGLVGRAKYVGTGFHEQTFISELLAEMNSQFPIFSMVPFGVPSCLTPIAQHSAGGREVMLGALKHIRKMIVVWFDQIEGPKASTYTFHPSSRILVLLGSLQ